MSGRICSDSVNVDNAVSRGNKQMEEFDTFRPEGFYGSLNSKIITMKSNKNNGKFGKNTAFDSQLIYGCMIGLMSTRYVDMKDIMYHELSLVPTSIFGDDKEMRIATTKSTHKKKNSRLHILPEQ